MYDSDSIFDMLKPSPIKEELTETLSPISLNQVLANQLDENLLEGKFVEVDQFHLELNEIKEFIQDMDQLIQSHTEDDLSEIKKRRTGYIVLREDDTIRDYLVKLCTFYRNEITDFHNLTVVAFNRFCLSLLI